MTHPSFADLPERIARLGVTCAGVPVAELLKTSVYSLRYAKGVRAEQAVSLLLPIEPPEHVGPGTARGGRG